MIKDNPDPHEADTVEVDETQERSRREKLADHFESTYSLKPNENYDSNEYHYETDRHGRIKHCEGTLRLEEGKRYNNHQVRVGGEDRLETDEGGHLIAKEFGGSGRVDNLVPMDGDLNHGEYREMEVDWEKSLKRGDNVDVKITCIYSGDSERPSAFKVKYEVTDENGFTRRETKYFKNGKDD